jgi:hypothetical protein
VSPFSPLKKKIRPTNEKKSSLKLKEIASAIQNQKRKFMEPFYIKEAEREIQKIREAKKEI